MKRLKLLSFVAILTAICVEASDYYSPEKIKELRETANAVIGAIPEKMPGAEKDTAARIKLGEKLYFENRLSQNNSISCNTCHRVDNHRGGVDNEPTSPGAFGKRGAGIHRQC